MSTTLKTGDKAPEIKAQTYGGETLKLSDYKDKTVALYFYPQRQHKHLHQRGLLDEGRNERA